MLFLFGLVAKSKQQIYVEVKRQLKNRYVAAFGGSCSVSKFIGYLNVLVPNLMQI